MSPRKEVVNGLRKLINPLKSRPMSPSQVVRALRMRWIMYWLPTW